LLSSELQKRVEQLHKDVMMLAELERIALERARVRNDHYDDSGLADECRQVFEAYGIDVARLEPDEASNLVQSSAIRKHLVAALYEWAFRLSDDEKKHANNDAEQLMGVARQAESPLEKQLREAALSGDSGEFERLLLAAPILELPPTMIYWLSARRLVPTLRHPENRASFQGIEFLRRAQARYPSDFWINHSLAFALTQLRPPRQEEAVGFYRAAVALRPESPGVHVNFGLALMNSGLIDAAIVAFQKALELKPDFADAHTDLGIALIGKGMLDEAIAECRQAVALTPSEAEYHSNLGSALREKNLLEEAIAEYREAIALKPDLAGPYDSWGRALQKKGMLDEAIIKYREAIALKPDFAEAYIDLGNALKAKDLLDEAATQYRKAAAFRPDSAVAYYNLGNAARLKGMLDEAVTQYRKAIDVKPDYAEAYCNLGEVLIRQGRFGEALFARKRGHELGLRNAASWNYPSAEWVKQAELLVELDAELPKILRGEAQSGDVDNQLALALMCWKYKGIYSAAVRFYSEAFAVQPGLADNLRDQHRYYAARAAVLAGCGQGNDAHLTDSTERVRLRRQALDWLRADLARCRYALGEWPDEARPFISQRMACWAQDNEFAGVRGTDALAKLPEAERAEWTKLWQGVAALGKQAVEGKATKESSTTTPELVPLPKEVEDQNHSSLNLIDRPFRVARDELLALRINEQVELFQHDRADQGVLPPWFDDRGESSMPAEKLDVGAFGFLTLGTTAVGVPNLDLVSQRQAEILRDRLRQHEHCGSRVDHAFDPFPAHLVRRKESAPNEHEVVVVCYFKLNTESSHSVGSFVLHDCIPPQASGG
jgi:tetratricopeptide (TPR) repeat protein